jgi:hypothetical protein
MKRDVDLSHCAEREAAHASYIFLLQGRLEEVF